MNKLILSCDLYDFHFEYPSLSILIKNIDKWRKLIDHHIRRVDASMVHMGYRTYLVDAGKYYRVGSINILHYWIDIDKEKLREFGRLPDHGKIYDFIRSDENTYHDLRTGILLTVFDKACRELDIPLLSNCIGTEEFRERERTLLLEYLASEDSYLNIPAGTLLSLTSQDTRKLMIRTDRSLKVLKRDDGIWAIANRYHIKIPADAILADALAYGDPAIEMINGRKVRHSGYQRIYISHGAAYSNLKEQARCSSSIIIDREVKFDESIDIHNLKCDTPRTYPLIVKDRPWTKPIRLTP